jgi:hypothetical protein
LQINHHFIHQEEAAAKVIIVWVVDQSSLSFGLFFLWSKWWWPQQQRTFKKLKYILQIIKSKHTKQRQKMADLDEMLEDAFEDCLPSSSGDTQTKQWGDPKVKAATSNDIPVQGNDSDDDMYGDDDDGNDNVDFDALLDEVSDDFFKNVSIASTDTSKATTSIATTTSSSSSKALISTTTDKMPSNPVSRTLHEAGLPLTLSNKWASVIIADQVTQARMTAPKPFSRAYRGGHAENQDSNEHQATGEGGESNTTTSNKSSTGGGSNSSSNGNKFNELFNDTLKQAITGSKFKNMGVAKELTVVLHGKNADHKLLEVLKKKYLNQVSYICIYMYMFIGLIYIYFETSSLH